MTPCVYCGRQNAEGLLFCTACGCSLAQPPRPVARLTWEEEAREREYRLSEAERCVGRDRDNDLVVDDTQASGQHLRVTCSDGAFYAEDMGSRNGTYINGERIQGRQRLKNEDLIKVGQTFFKFTI